jgi:hypothetical protein
MRVGGQRHVSAALPPGKSRYTLCRRLGGSQGRSGQVRKISPPPGFDPRTVQPVANRYTDWAIPAHIYIGVKKRTDVETKTDKTLKYIKIPTRTIRQHYLIKQVGVHCLDCYVILLRIWVERRYWSANAA